MGEARVPDQGDRLPPSDESANIVDVDHRAASTPRSEVMCCDCLAHRWTTCEHERRAGHQGIMRLRRIAPDDRTCRDPRPVRRSSHHPVGAGVDELAQSDGRELTAVAPALVPPNGSLGSEATTTHGT